MRRRPRARLMAAGRMRSRSVANEFEWVDFALQPPSAMAESLDAAGVDGGVPDRRGEADGRG